MLEELGVKGTSLLDALRESFVIINVSDSIPKFIKKAMGMLRRDANAIRRENEIKELKDL